MVNFFLGVNYVFTICIISMIQNCFDNNVKKQHQLQLNESLCSVMVHMSVGEQHAWKLKRLDKKCKLKRQWRKNLNDRKIIECENFH
jgi:hypothetical protein